MRLTLVALALVAMLALPLSLAPAAAAPTPAGSCYEVVAIADAAPDAVWRGVLHDPIPNESGVGDARFELTRADTGETAAGSLEIASVEWSLLLHALSASTRAETWQLSDGDTLRFAYAVEGGSPAAASGGGAADGWTWLATARC